MVDYLIPPPIMGASDDIVTHWVHTLTHVCCTLKVVEFTAHTHSGEGLGDLLSKGGLCRIVSVSVQQFEVTLTNPITG